MHGEQQAIMKRPPAPAAANERNSARTLTLAAGVPASQQIAGVPTVGPANIAPFGGCFVSFVWIPTVASQIVRLSFSGTAATAAATDRAYAPGVEYDVWVDSLSDFVNGLSAGGGELSYHVSD